MHAQELTHELAQSKITLKPSTIKSFDLATHSKPNYYIPDSAKPTHKNAIQSPANDFKSGDIQFIPDSSREIQFEQIQSGDNQYIPESKELQFRPYLSVFNENYQEQINLPENKKIFPDTIVKLDLGNEELSVVPQKALEQFFGW